MKYDSSSINISIGSPIPCKFIFIDNKIRIQTKTKNDVINNDS